jgi:predicted amidohydrolase
MHTRNVAEILNDEGLVPPDLEMLRPTTGRYTALLMQPSGPIFANSHRIGPSDLDLAASKGREFLELARARGAHLAVTPEYFLPWTALTGAITDGVTPAADALWVLGCESVTQDRLEQFKQDIAAAHCIVFHEPWANLPLDRHLLDPVVLLFQAKRPDQSTQLVALVQFKTYPSRDDLFIEEELLRKGSEVYKFRGSDGPLSVAVIICSDAFEVEPVLSELNDQSTLIHIQLNPHPTNSVYRGYRTTTFQTDPRATNCHIICLNWAHSIVQQGDPGTDEEQWDKGAASTWYCPKGECSSHDDTVLLNHRLGLYYAYMEERRHALLFHYDEAVFELLVPKLFTTGPAVMANHLGPKITRRSIWQPDPGQWLEKLQPPETGFDPYIAAYGDAHAALQHVLAANDPLAVERVLALSAGAVSAQETWHSLENIDSCTIAPDEVVRRLTVIQDSFGNDFRHRRISVIAQIRHVLHNFGEWPTQVSGLDADSIVQWSNANPNFNVQTAAGKLTLVVYLDDSHPPSSFGNKADMLCELLRKAGGPCQKRLCIIWREYGQIKFVPLPALTRFDDALLELTKFTTIHPLEDTGTDHG